MHTKNTTTRIPIQPTVDDTRSPPPPLDRLLKAQSKKKSDSPHKDGVEETSSGCSPEKVSFGFRIIYAQCGVTER